jgi:hypothetical protein
MMGFIELGWDGWDMLWHVYMDSENVPISTYTSASKEL